MSVRADEFDLAGLGLAAGEGRRLPLRVRIPPLELANERFVAVPDEVEAVLDVSRMTGFGYAFRLRFAAAIGGPCMRCLADAAPVVEVDSREVHQPGGGPELESPTCSVTRSTCRPGRMTRLPSPRRHRSSVGRTASGSARTAR